MRRLSSIIFLMLVTMVTYAQKSPHGEGLTISCQECHNAEGWKIDMKSLSFNHDQTGFHLVGQHKAIGCKQCHLSLEFKKTGNNCIDCHTDIHAQTLGPDCGRCHTPSSWVVNDITGMHMRGRFPLVGAHVTADCFSCHKDAKSNFLLFGPLGVQCIDCHRDNYNSTTNPNHINSDFSTNCIECHNMTAFSWTGADINHNFFPLTAGHDIKECQKCHKSGSYANTSPACISCHQPDYSSTNNPGHAALQFSTNCSECHTTNPGWRPADYKDHDSKSFPIYSGSHKGQWGVCSDCHPNSSNYGQYTCINCHKDGQHEGVPGYAYNNEACLACHPTGSKDGINHNVVFPLTGAHATTQCSKCHTNGYPNTPTTCVACHQANYNQSANPGHTKLNIPLECATCHTTVPGWKPATFAIHNNYYVIAGTHVQIATNCAVCHNGNYNTTPNTCEGCHLANYNSTTNPSHSAAQFPTTCIQCHNQTAWSPSSWNHDNQYFPIYSGRHNGTWSKCTDCHTNVSNYSVYSCIDCHQHNPTSTNSSHQGVSGYSYNSIACFTCHPKGNAGKMPIKSFRNE